MRTYQLIASAGSRGAVLKKQFSTAVANPWERALRVLRDALDRDPGILPADKQVLLTLQPVTENQEG